ncbi:MAG: Rieske 2Fe-2S domain-containing protein [Nitriliruptorales bacterium]|nr:Rieske 2Fe-2S domain-containing protein [Nitriliruptorales bacterium]
MPTVAFLSLAVFVAALLLAAFWWIRRENLAVYPAGRQPRNPRPLPTGCDLGAQLMAAQDTRTPATPPAAPSRPSGAGGGAPAPKRKSSSGPTRRTFLRNSWLISMLGLLGGFGGASLAFLWPNLRGGFGAEIDVDDEQAVLDYIRDNQEPFPYPAGRMYLIDYDAALDPDGEYAEVTDGGSAPLMAIYQVCVHLGCKVPWCLSAQWFQCPCHGSNYNRWGEWQLGPAPRGLDRFSLRVENGRVLVDTGTVITGPSREGGVLQQPQEGPSCI